MQKSVSLLLATASLISGAACNVVITQSGLSDSWTMSTTSDIVTIGAQAMFPDITIPLGTQVTFKGQTGGYHFFRVTAQDGTQFIEAGMGGAPFSETFNAPSIGTYKYFCPPHQSYMKGTIYVVAAATNAPTNSPTNPPTKAPTNPPTNAPTDAPTYSAIIKQVGQSDSWMLSTTSDIVTIGAQAMFPDITVPLGTEVTFEGQTGDAYFFRVTGQDGTQFIEAGMGGVPFSEKFYAPSTGTYKYFCPNHQSYMKGEIFVVPAPPPTASPTNSPTNAATDAPTNPPTNAATDAPTKLQTNPPTSPTAADVDLSVAIRASSPRFLASAATMAIMAILLQ